MTIKAKPKSAKNGAARSSSATAKTRSKKGFKSKSLVQSWLEVELDVNGKTLAEALRSLNTALGSAHTHSRVREWETNRNGRGDRLPRRVRVYMSKIALRDLLRDSNINPDKLTPRALTQLCERLN